MITFSFSRSRALVLETAKDIMAEISTPGPVRWWRRCRRGWRRGAGQRGSVRKGDGGRRLPG